MEHNSVVSGHPKSTGILQVDWLSTGPSGLTYFNLFSISLAYFKYFND